jgi:hypothetical protein
MESSRRYRASLRGVNHNSVVRSWGAATLEFLFTFAPALSSTFVAVSFPTVIEVSTIDVDTGFHKDRYLLMKVVVSCKLKGAHVSKFIAAE